jgi:magnesium transporter
LKKRSKKAGLSPGSLVHIGKTYVEKSKIKIMRYDEASLGEKEINSIKELREEKDRPGVLWINIDGLQDVQLLGEVGTLFGLHPLILEDILNTDQRPKMEDFCDYIYIVLKNFYNQTDEVIHAEQVSIILGKNFVLSFMEKKSEIFEPIRERLRANKGKIRKVGGDYLVHAIMDNIVDNYFGLLENLEEKIENLEDDLVKQTTPATLQEIHNLKRELIYLRKSLWPLREAISSLQRSDSPLISESSVIYFKDIFDHVIAIIDTVETFRDTLSGMLDIYLSSISIKLNEVMKVLTIIATIFMPLTFLAGVYGMNFKHMPELEWHWGYFGLWGIMLTIAILMLIFFRRKKWL